MREPKSILLIKLGSLGDVLHAVPTLWALRQRFPRAHIAWLVDHRYEPLLLDHAALDRTIPAWGPSLRARMALDHIVRASFQFGVISKLRKWKFDMVVDLQGLFRSAVLAAATGARIRVGFADAREFAPLFYTHLVSVPRTSHAVERCRAVAIGLGALEEEVRFELAVNPVARVTALRLGEQMGFRAAEPYVLIAPSSSNPIKNWTPQGFATVIRTIWDSSRLRSMVIGAKDDSVVCQRIAAWSGTPAVALTEQSLAILVALVARSRLVIGNDSGPLHLAAAMGRPLVGIFGPTDPAHTGPWDRSQFVVRGNESCPTCRLAASRNPDRPRFPNLAKRHTCLSEISVASVMAKVDRALADLERN